MMRNLRQVLSLLPLALFISLTVYFIAFHHVWPLSRDQWHMYASYFEKGLWTAALTPMSDHRHLVPFLFFHADMAWFGGLNHFLVFIGALFDLAIIGLLLLALSRDQHLCKPEKMIWAIWIIFLLSWLINIAQLGWGFMSTQYYLAILCCLVAVSAAPHSKTLMIVSGLIATFSFGMGILVWPVLLIVGWLQRADIRFYALIIVALIVSLSLFLLMPGGRTIENNLLFFPAETIRFVFELPAGPIYYLLKSYRFIDAGLLQAGAVWISITAVGTSLVVFGWIVWTRPLLSPFLHLCLAIALIGLGSSIMITFVRTGGFLDIWVDRYQIWAVLFWCGMLPIVCHLAKKCFPMSLMMLLPLLALPSQLDMGARLAEYNLRVEQSLLVFQAGIPDREAAEDALHWNWENKLPSFFTVWQHLATERKNIFAASHADMLGQAITTIFKTTNDADVPQVTIKTLKQEGLFRQKQIDLSTIPEAAGFAVASTMTKDIPGYRIYAEVPDSIDWSYALWINDANIVVGVGVPVMHNLLPRGNFRQLNKDYNLYGVIRNEGKISKILLINNRGIRTGQADQ